MSAETVLSLLDELESYHDALDDVMGALSQALDGDDMYSERPAEVVWRLRDQRDEAVAYASRLEGEMEVLINET